MEPAAVKAQIEAAFFSATLITVYCSKWAGKARVVAVSENGFSIEGNGRAIEIRYGEVWYAGKQG